MSLKSFLDNGNSVQIQLYPITEYNLDGIKMIYDNSMRMGSSNNSNVFLATINPSAWLPELLQKYYNKISYASSGPVFNTSKLIGDSVHEKNYTTISKTIESDEDLDLFFSDGKWRRFVIFSIVKYADLNKMITYYVIRYADITEDFEVRDKKISDIIC